MDAGTVVLIVGAVVNDRGETELAGGALPVPAFENADVDVDIAVDEVAPAAVGLAGLPHAAADAATAARAIAKPSRARQYEVRSTALRDHIR